jgi:hypothetical protein
LLSLFLFLPASHLPQPAYASLLLGASSWFVAATARLLRNQPSVCTSADCICVRGCFVLCISRLLAGDLPGVQWLHQQGIPFSAATSAAAAGAGQLHVLQFLQAEGCCMDVSAADAAARAGQLGVLHWLRDCWLQGQQLGPAPLAESCCQVRVTDECHDMLV